MSSIELINTVQGYDKYIEQHGIDETVINAYCEASKYALLQEKDREYGLQLTAKAKNMINSLVLEQTNGMDIWMLEKYQQDNETDPYSVVNNYYEMLKCESFYNFESFMLYMEKNRPYKKRFYQPRRKTLSIVVSDLQNLEDTNTKFQGVSQPSRTGKSTVCIQFLLWIALKRPNSHNAMGGHSGVLAKGFYKELLNMMTTEEYTFQELFFFWHPEYKNKPFPTDKSADDLTITLGDPDRFATITCRGIDGTWTGAVDVSKDGYLYVDDLIRDREHSLSPNRMENTFQEYLNKMVDRKNDGAKELMVGTLWNVLDPLERIRKQYADNPLFRFRKIPALNENDESNFDYEINGFSTTYYREMRERLDNAEWMAKFQQQPYVREGILFQESELRYFNGILPELDHRIVAIVDVALGGGDSLSMPIGAEYENGDVYIFDWVFNRGSKEITLPIVTGKIIGNEIRQIRFEANQGGDLYCGLVDEMLRTQNYKCSCTHRKAPNKMEKKSKIIAYSGDVKRKFIFLKPGIPSEEQKEQDRLNGVTRYYRSKEYQAAMDEFTTFVTIGDNNFDDAADSITQLEMFIENPTGVRKTVIMSNFW